MKVKVGDIVKTDNYYRVISTTIETDSKGNPHTYFMGTLLMYGKSLRPVFNNNVAKKIGGIYGGYYSPVTKEELEITLKLAQKKLDDAAKSVNCIEELIRELS